MQANEERLIELSDSLGVNTEPGPLNLRSIQKPIENKNCKLIVQIWLALAGSSDDPDC